MQPEDQRIRTISFVVTLYNKARYLPQVWAGLVAQQGDFQRQFVFVDDGSTDNTVEVLLRLVGDMPGVVVLQQANSGPAAALNAGLEAAHGDYIKLVDGDDVLLPWCTAWLLRALEESGAHAACALPGSQRPYSVGPIEGDGVSFAEPAALEWDLLDMLPLSLRRAQTMPSLWLVRQDALLACGGCDQGVFIQDYSLELRLAAAGPLPVLRGPVVAFPQVAPGRLSDNQAQTLHDVNVAALRFLATSPGLSPRLHRLALERVVGRAYLWAIRRGCPVQAPMLLVLRLLAMAGLMPASYSSEALLCRPFRSTHPIRVPAERPSLLRTDR